MNKNIILALVVGLVIGVSGTVGVTALTKDNVAKQASDTQQTTVTNNGSMSMADMNRELATKTGSEFDKAFIEMMIKHHQGAIEMAKLSETRANRQEIKTLSQNIISAQEKEISEMQQWQMNWGYNASDTSMPGMNH